MNLIVNARDAMGGKGHIRIRVLPCGADSGVPKAFVAEPPRYVCVCVEDDGPGITDDVRRRPLEPFFMTKGDAGTGMGLAQVYGFMRQLGGNLLLESAPHRGTAVRVSLFLPVAPDLDPQSHVQDKNSDPLTSVPRARPTRCPPNGGTRGSARLTGYRLRASRRSRRLSDLAFAGRAGILRR